MVVMRQDHASNKQTSELTFRETGSKRLGVARITLLRARADGRIRFFRIGTRVLYSDEHLVEFLQSCERNKSKQKHA